MDNISDQFENDEVHNLSAKDEPAQTEEKTTPPEVERRGGTELRSGKDRRTIAHHSDQERRSCKDRRNGTDRRRNQNNQ